MAAAPHLVAVALQPVTRGGIHSAFAHLDLVPTCRAGRNLVGGHLGDPVGGNHLLASELPSVEKAQAHLGQVFRSEIQSPSPGVDSGGALLPMGFLDSQRLPQAAVKIVHDLLSGHLLYGCGKYIGTEAVVAVAGAGLIFNGPFHETPDPVSVIVTDGGCRILPVPGVHGQKVANCDPLESVGRILRHTLGEYVDNPVLKLEQSF